MAFSEPIRIVAAVILFSLVVLILYSIFGAPVCSAQANATVAAFASTFNEVNAGSFPMYEGDGIPVDRMKFKTVPVFLCQQNGELSFVIGFLGGFPEYQLYYETFPKGFLQSDGPVETAGMWDEAYPWSGGAAAGLVFLGALKGATYTYKGTKLLAKTVKASVSTVKKSLEAARALRKAWKELDIKFKNTEELTKYLNRYPKATQRYLSAEIFGDVINEPRAVSAVNILRESGVIHSETKVRFTGASIQRYKIDKITQDGKLPLSRVKTPVKVTVFEDGQEVEKIIVVKWKDAGESVADKFRLINLNGEVPTGFKKFETIPAEDFRTYIDDLATPNEKDLLRKIYSTDWELSKLVNDYDMTKTGMWESFKLSIKNFKTRITALKKVGYDIDKTVNSPAEVDGLADALGSHIRKDPEILKSLEKTHPFTRLKQKILTSLGLPSDSYVSRQIYSKYINDVMKRTSGLVIVPKGSKKIVYDASMKIIRDSPTDDVSTIFKKMTDDGIIPKEGSAEWIEYGYQRKELEDIIQKVKDLHSSGITEREFAYRVNANYLDNYVSAKNMDQEELFLLIGYLEQNADMAPISAFANYGRLQGKKMIYLQGSSVSVPTGWYAKGIAGSLLTEQCTANSLCLYDHNAQLESPFVLSDATSQYFIRNWRPVNQILAYTPIQGLLFHPPEHPRFHVVSPCFAIAKVWKTDYQGVNTTFVSFQKCDIKNDKGETTASNYCFADESLVNSYLAVWTGSDACTVIQSAIPGGAAWTAVKTVFNVADPCSLIQVAGETTLAWPGQPWKDLNYDKAKEAAPTCNLKEAVLESSCMELSKRGCSTDPSDIKVFWANDLGGDGKPGTGDDTLQKFCEKEFGAGADDKDACRKTCGCST
ncbi:MAG TPA: hypothetical protein VJH90_03190 [archaeon]|nr:hypothetical protein [archaeon]